MALEMHKHYDPVTRAGEDSCHQTRGADGSPTVAAAHVGG